MTQTTLKAEIKILMEYFRIPASDFQKLITLHDSVENAHHHLAILFDDRKANKN